MQSVASVSWADAEETPFSAAMYRRADYVLNRPDLFDLLRLIFKYLHAHFGRKIGY